MIHAFGGDTVEVSDYERFGSDELAAAVHKALGDRRGVLLRNHGAVVHGPSLKRAYDLAVLLEWLAELYWRSSVFGEPRILSHEQLEEVATEARAGLRRSRRRDRGSVVKSPKVVCLGVHLLDVLVRHPEAPNLQARLAAARRPADHRRGDRRGAGRRPGEARARSRSRWA